MFAAVLVAIVESPLQVLQSIWRGVRSGISLARTQHRENQNGDQEKP
jgi:hypothetical protein